jgi:nucleotide-binding universal stress UspA family protein
MTMVVQPVVVGVDDTEDSLAAVGFAATEASVRGTSLHIVHAAGRPSPFVRHHGATDRPDRWDPDVDRLMAAAQARAREAVPDLAVDTTVIADDAVAALAHQSRSASVLVVGRRRRPLAKIRSTTVVANIAAHASCPVIVAQGVSEATANIVVGVGGLPTAEAAIGFAFAEAEARCTGVTAVHAFRSPVLAGRGVDGGVAWVGEHEGNAVAARTLSEALAGWRERYPDIVVRRTAPEGSVTDALVHASTWAQMLVIGTEGGPVTAVSRIVHEVVRRALCPVAIVPP